METTIDNGGRIVIPKAMRERLGLRRGSAVKIELRDGRVEIEPVPREVRVEERGGRLVLVAPEGTPPLTSGEVAGLIEQGRKGEG